MHASVHGVRVPWSGIMTYQGARRLPQAHFLILSLGHWLPLTPATCFPSPPHSSALLSHGFSWRRGGEYSVEDFVVVDGRGGNLVVSNAGLNQKLKVMAREAKAGWDITINLSPLAQWYICLWVPARNVCDLQLSLCLCMQSSVAPKPRPLNTQGFLQ